MVYRQTFRPSQHLEKPRFMLAVNVFAADDDETGAYLRTSMQQAFINLRSGRPGLLPRPDMDFLKNTDPGLLAQVDHALSVTAAGSPGTVKAKLAEFIARYQPDELILTGQIHDHEARKHSFEIAAKVLGEMG